MVGRVRITNIITTWDLDGRDFRKAILSKFELYKMVQNSKSTFHYLCHSATKGARTIPLISLDKQCENKDTEVEHTSRLLKSATYNVATFRGSIPEYTGRIRKKNDESFYVGRFVLTICFHDFLHCYFLIYNSLQIYVYNGCCFKSKQHAICINQSPPAYVIYIQHPPIRSATSHRPLIPFDIILPLRNGIGAKLHSR